MPEPVPTADSGRRPGPGGIDVEALRVVADLAALALARGPEAKKRLEEARGVIRLFGELIRPAPATAGGRADPRSARPGAAPCRLRADAPASGFAPGRVAELAPARVRRLVRVPRVL